MQIVIDLPVSVIVKAVNDAHTESGDIISKAIANGIQLPSEHGRLIDVDDLENLSVSWGNKHPLRVEGIVWVGPYKEGSNEDNQSNTV